MSLDSEAGQSTSVWNATSEPLARPGLDADVTTDVCIVGAGIAGLSAAYLLARDGRKVIVLDDGAIGSGETGHTTAHLSNALDDRYFELERLHGSRGTQIAAESHTAAIDRIEAIIREEAIECAFERVAGYLFVPPDQSADVLNSELEATHRVGLGDVRLKQRAPIDSFDTGPCLEFPNQAQFHPLDYLAGLARGIERRGGQIFLGTHVDIIEGGEPARVTTALGHVVTANAIVVATNTPVQDIVTIHTKQMAYRTFVVGARVPEGSVPNILLWDTADPYHYVRRASGAGDGFDLLIVGGEDHKAGQADDADERYERLEQWARERFPVESIVWRWSGQVMEPVDGVAFIGLNPGDENVYIATGDSGNGMTHGTIAGILLADLIAGRENAWATLFDPSRLPLRALAKYTQENLNTAAQFKDWVTPGEVDNVGEIAAGSGAIVRRGLAKVAAYRDDDGQLIELSATCTHLGCIVHWNSSERSWDCPCHGSRFDVYGRVLNGPAISNLGPAEE
jgi:glycine/D-amino acid oxidase-like deaminating enzyme/nitrite reductase/ring-hydroxylating ferredoxin subunit